MTYQPRFTITPNILSNTMDIAEALTRKNLSRSGNNLPHLRRTNRLRSIHSSLSIEGNSLSLDDVNDIIDGKMVEGPKNEILEIKNAYAAYELLDTLDPFSIDDLTRVHGTMMGGLVNDAGYFRKGDEGVFDGDGNRIHIAPSPKLVPVMMGNLFEWMRTSDYPMVIRSCVFHYEFEYIHPFGDGNGRMGRFWQTLLLSKYDESFKWIPIESMIRAHQREYYDAIAASNDDCDCTRFLEFMTGMIRDSLIRYIESTDREDVDTNIRLSPNELSVYAMIRDGHFIDIDQAARQIDVSRPTMNRYLKTLKDNGLIEKIGNKRSGVWVVRKEGH